MKFAIIGGDLRIVKLAEMLAKEENEVYVYGVEKAIDLKDFKNIKQCDTIKKAIQDVEIVIDRYPFGIALEIENKSILRNPEEVIMFWVNKLGLNIDKAFRLSWDDKYTQLCREQNVEIFKNVTFDLPMPKVID